MRGVGRVLFCVLSILLYQTLADISFSSPPAGSLVAVGTLSVQWTDSGTAPLLSSLTSYQLFLCAGGNDAASIVVLSTITAKGLFADGNAAVGTVTAGMGASTPKNAYFLKMISAISTGGTVVNYSPRFSLTGMTGTFPAAVSAALVKLGSANTAGPTREVTSAATAAAAPAGAAGFSIAFAQQSPPIYYAPMMQIAPSSLPNSNVKPTMQNPSSPVTIATTFLQPNTAIVKTVTQSPTWSFSQRENPATPAAGPAGSGQQAADMQRFLERWKD